MPATTDGRFTVDARSGASYSPPVTSMPIGEARDRLADLAQRLEALGRYL